MHHARQVILLEARRFAGDTSLYARPNDTRDFAEQVTALLDDPTWRQSIGEIGRTRIEDGFAWHHQMPKLLAAYETPFANDR